MELSYIAFRVGWESVINPLDKLCWNYVGLANNVEWVEGMVCMRVVGGEQSMMHEAWTCGVED